MTYEEAIEFTKINVEIYCKDCLYQDDCSRTDNCRCTEWEKMVVEALEKQRHMCGNCNIWHPEIGWCEERGEYTDEDMQCPDWSDEE